MNCFTCKQEITPGTERKWGKTFKCSECMRMYANV